MRNGLKNALALLATLVVVGTVLAGCSGGSASQIIDQKPSERSGEGSNSDASNRDVTRIRPGSPAYAPGLNYYEVAIPGGEVVRCLQTPSSGDYGGGLSCDWANPIVKPPPPGD